MSKYYRGGRGRDDVCHHHCRHYGHRANECRLLLREQLLQAYNYQAQAFGFPVLTAAAPVPAAPPVPAPAVAHWAPLAAPPIAAPVFAAPAPTLRMYNYQAGQYGFPPVAATAPAPAAPSGEGGSEMEIS